MNEDIMHVEILADGTLKVTTDPISAPNHAGAEQLLTLLSQKLGGPTDVQKRGHSHSHGHTHTHGTHTHTH